MWRASAWARKRDCWGLQQSRFREFGWVRSGHFRYRNAKFSSGHHAGVASSAMSVGPNQQRTTMTSPCNASAKSKKPISIGWPRSNHGSYKMNPVAVAEATTTA